jgi:thiol-disulfide isomerase/thioredoxin
MAADQVRTGSDGAGKVPPRPGTNPSVPSRAYTRPSGYGTNRPGGRPGPRASARQLSRRRQHKIYMVSGTTVVVIVVIGVIIAVSLTGGGGTTTQTSKGAPGGVPLGTFAVPQALVNKVGDVPVSALVGAVQASPSAETLPEKLPARADALTVDGKPAILYIGAEWCPYCAAERWALVMALSKFGTFGPLRGTTSSPTDYSPSTPTFSFYGAGYTSKYLAFVPVEQETNNRVALQSPTKAQKALFTQWDAPPYVDASNAGAIPFLYLAGKYLLLGAQYASVAISGMPFTKAVSYLTSGTNVTSKQAEASAGYLVGDLCTLTHNQPSTVCAAVPAKLKGKTASVPGAGAGN